MDKIARRNRYFETGEVFVEKLKACKYSVVLDLGCRENLYNDIEGMIGVDIDSPHADVHANINRLPFEDETVDCIIAFGSLIYGDRDEHLGMDGDLLLRNQLKEITRVLRSGGLLYGRTRYLDILSEIAIDKYEQEYGFKRMSVRTILHVKSGEKRLYWEWVKY